MQTTPTYISALPGWKDLSTGIPIRCDAAAPTPLPSGTCPGYTHPVMTSYASKAHTLCGLDAGGNAFCWGNHKNGPLRIGASHPCLKKCTSKGVNFPGGGSIDIAMCAALPLPVNTSRMTGAKTFSQVKSNGTDPILCGLSTDYNLYCWGLDAYTNGKISTPRMGLGTVSHH